MKLTDSLTLIGIWIFWLCVILGGGYLLKRWLLPQAPVAFWLGTLGLLAGFAIMAVGIAQLLQDDIVTRYAIATVTQRVSMPAGPDAPLGGSVQAQANYTDAAGTTHTVGVSRMTPAFTVGDVVPVAYRADSPDAVRSYVTKQAVVRNTLMIMLTGGLLLAGGALLRLWAA